ncbi:MULTISPECIES: hypothetical protein [unclassified Clostridium]|uniref:hypothetical protein n=1 Tax=unclassified Clostridium TaxID=2614128 RepID=UPI0002983D24|nr:MULTISPECIES: hypothetical protein [unclassified Clostridium]EKQ57397.1 MAG: hypothetical protein A370_00968 [Clostridium sp. Maddingley MBC34-26]
MISNRKQLFFGIALGILGNSFYHSIKEHKDKFYYMKDDISNQCISTTDLSKNSTNDEMINCIKELKEQANLLQIKLNQLKN